MANCAGASRRRKAAAMEAVVREAGFGVRPGPEEAMEEDVPMRRYISPNAVPGTGGCAPRAGCRGEETQAMLEQLVELNCAQNQLLCDLLGAVNALTAAMLSARQKS